MEHINDILAKHFSNFSLSGEEQEILDNWIAENEQEYAVLSETLKPNSSYQYSEFDTKSAWQKNGTKRIEEKTNKSNFYEAIIKVCGSCKYCNNYRHHRVQLF